MKDEDTAINNLKIGKMAGPGEIMVKELQILGEFTIEFLTKLLNVACNSIYLPKISIYCFSLLSILVLNYSQICSIASTIYPKMGGCVVHTKEAYRIRY